MTVKNAAGTGKTKTELLAAMTDVTPDENKVYQFTGDTTEWFEHFTLPGHTTIDGDVRVAFEPNAQYTLNYINRLYPAAVIHSITPHTALGTGGGTVLVVKGDNLTGVSGVTFGGTAGTSLVIVSLNELHITTPAKSAGTYDVVFTDDSGTTTVTGGATYA